MNAYAFKQQYNLYYTGIYGKQKEPTIEDWDKKINLITGAKTIDTALELFQVIEAIPPFQDVQSGFSYYWFKEGTYPSWEKCPDASVLEYKHEERDEFVKEQPDKWMDIKCKYEAKIVSLLMLWMGNSNEAFTTALKGIVIKIRRARITIQLWYEGNTEDVREPLKQALDCKGMEIKDMSISDIKESSSRRGSRSSSRKDDRDNSRSRNESSDRNNRNHSKRRE
ncbi:Eukaryotic_initiation factor 4E [Hexamita inflata]|uniref:Eukaryotic initiation factor 4E n=1 Tax=Hexamita inflata TaxID=28002 RepID=A0AA86NPC6_9EUKA|nr:Eukaryotic initiation factor 4E [Hexamita inflata]CAI9923117.1 Eukaryotic initiation factor 4E [Hexamita inflata]CAI9972596.1 Eukaryotic initiation factor 4E [Hexamita inflata]